MTAQQILRVSIVGAIAAILAHYLQRLASKWLP